MFFRNWISVHAWLIWQTPTNLPWLYDLMWSLIIVTMVRYLPFAIYEFCLNHRAQAFNYAVLLHFMIFFTFFNCYKNIMLSLLVSQINSPCLVRIEILFYLLCCYEHIVTGYKSDLSKFFTGHRIVLPCPELEWGMFTVRIFLELGSRVSGWLQSFPLWTDVKQHWWFCSEGRPGAVRWSTMMSGGRNIVSRCWSKLLQWGLQKSMLCLQP